MTSVKRTAALVLVATLIAAGCGGTGAQPAGSSTATPPPARLDPTPQATFTPRPTTTVPTVEPTPRLLYDPNADARADIAAAIAAAKADGRHVLLDFGADWCPDCHVLAAYLESTEGRALVERAFHVVSIDVGYWDHNLDVAKDHGDAIWNGIPAVVVLKPDGSIVGSSKDGTLATASAMTQDAVLAYLETFAP
jgi:thiol:disulfide interchange protein